ncbi:lysosomal acid lipase/cholesteryl ester hydrolase, partial [Tremellales sp. Uapishka_1]
MASHLPTAITSVAATILSPLSPSSSSDPARLQSLLTPSPGAPLTNDPSLVPSRYLEKYDEESGAPVSPSQPHVSLAKTSSLNPFPTRSAPPQPGSEMQPAPTYARAPSQLLDAPARAALSMPNGNTAAGQARAVRGGDLRTPDYEIDSDGDGIFVTQSSSRESMKETNGETQPLLAPTPKYPGPPDISRSTSADSTRSRSVLRRIFIDRAGTPSQHLSRPTFPPPSLSTYHPQPHSPLTFSAKFYLFFLQAFSIAISSVFLLFVVAWAFTAEIAKGLPRWIWPVKPTTFPWDNQQYWQKEGKKISKEPRDYARQIGMDIEDQTIESEDGYFLRYSRSPISQRWMLTTSRVHRVIDPEALPHTDGRGGFPVLVLHGLFQSSGSFITSEERSLAFWLAKTGGYQVYLGNTRGLFGMGHRNFKRGDPRFWDWTIRELAMYDLPALVEHVCRETGHDKIGFIGHSQGNGLTFISLSLGMCPSLGKKLSVFVALAPAVYAGPLTTGFPFTLLNRMEWSTWKRFFGVLDFIPVMSWAYDYCPPKLFATTGYIMFAFLFNWTDTNWLHRRKTKMFRFTPTPVSSASIFWWCGKGGFADRKCTLDDTLDRWFDSRFPPLSIYYGGRDFLVLTEPLLERLKVKEKDVNVIKVTKLDQSEVCEYHLSVIEETEEYYQHCDFYWAAEAVEWAYLSILDDIESTRPRYPEEDDEEKNGSHH